MSKRYPLFIALSILVILVMSLFFDVTGLISYGMMVLSIWLTVAIVFFWGIAWLLMKLRIIKRLFNIQSSLYIPFLLFVSGMAGIVFSNLYMPPAIPSAALPVDKQINYIYETDQGDRLAMRFIKLNERDTVRLLRILALYEQGVILSPENKYQAAMILQHGTKSEHYELAYTLAKESNEMGYENELWKAAYDRWMLSLGKPQVYGTQTTATFSIFGVSIEQK
ncbi:MAG TPA: hypothetical protein PK152_07355 [Anaerolineales bacterium]|nr:hypothetical protein [Anaerolineales bacterium]HRK88935.1 hypothetical protein [Anaerolineales bacterium]